MRIVPRTGARLAGGCALALLVGLSVGCSPSKTGVKGKVTHNGKAVPYGSVTLIGSDGIVYTGELKEDGSFAIDKVPTGTVKVGVVSPDPRPKDAAAGKGGGSEVGGFSRGDRRAAPPPESVIKAWFPIPNKYADPQTSGVTATVASGKDLVIELP